MGTRNSDVDIETAALRKIIAELHKLPSNAARRRLWTYLDGRIEEEGKVERGEPVSGYKDRSAEWYTPRV